MTLQNALITSESSVEIDTLPSSSDGSEISFWKDGRRFQAPTARSCDLPLADVTGPHFNFVSFKELWETVPPEPALIEMIKWITTATLSDTLRQHQFHQHPRHDITSRNTNLDISMLLSSGTVEPCRGGVLSAHVFTVPKSDNLHSRFIFDGRTFDDLFHRALGEPPPVDLPQIPRLLNTILEGKWKFISTCDAKNMFYQFGIHKSLRPFFSFRLLHQHEIAHFRLCALPMGICFAPALAQTVSLYIIRVVRYLNPNVDFQMFAWIDNFILVTTTREDDQTIRACFDNIATQLNFIIKGWEASQHSADILGIHIDMIDHTATATERHRVELQTLAQHLLTSQTAVARDFLKWFGKAQWLVYSVAQTPLCFFPKTMQLLRHIGRTESWNETCPLPHELKQEIRALSHLTCSGIRTYCFIESHADIWSDASTTALAAFHSTHRQALQISISTTHEKIFIAELLAGFFGFTALPPAGTWVCDNMAAVRAMVRGHSGNAIGDLILRLWIDSRRTPELITWVDTNCQLADQLTRSPPPQPKPCESPHLTFTVRWRWEGGTLLQNTRC